MLRRPFLCIPGEAPAKRAPKTRHGTHQTTTTQKKQSVWNQRTYRQRTGTRAERSERASEEGAKRTAPLEESGLLCNARVL